MRRFIALSIVIGAFAAGPTTANAAQPANPGCFGQDRAAYANVNGSLGNDVGGVGYYASQRAGGNGAFNQAYKTRCGGDPAP